MNIEITVPAFSRTYEFELNDNLPLSTLVEEIAGVICQRERCSLSGDVSQLLLLDAAGKKILDMNQTMIEADIQVGDRLILI